MQARLNILNVMEALLKFTFAFLKAGKRKNSRSKRTRTGTPAS